MSSDFMELGQTLKPDWQRVNELVRVRAFFSTRCNRLEPVSPDNVLALLKRYRSVQTAVLS